MGSLSFFPAHFYDILSNFPSKILFLPSTGHHPQKYHIRPSSDWSFEWLFWSLALSPLSLISRDQRTGSYNLQTNLNHNLGLRKCLEVKKKSVCFSHSYTSLLPPPRISWNAKWCQVTWCLRNLHEVWKALEVYKAANFLACFYTKLPVVNDCHWGLLCFFFSFSHFLSFSYMITSNSFNVWKHTSRGPVALRQSERSNKSKEMNEKENSVLDFQTWWI